MQPLPDGEIGGADIALTIVIVGVSVLPRVVRSTADASEPKRGTYRYFQLQWTPGGGGGGVPRKSRSQLQFRLAGAWNATFRHLIFPPWIRHSVDLRSGNIELDIPPISHSLSKQVSMTS